MKLFSVKNAISHLLYVIAVTNKFRTNKTITSPFYIPNKTGPSIQYEVNIIKSEDGEPKATLIGKLYDWYIDGELRCLETKVINSSEPVSDEAPCSQIREPITNVTLFVPNFNKLEMDEMISKANSYSSTKCTIKTHLEKAAVEISALNEGLLSPIDRSRLKQIATANARSLSIVDRLEERDQNISCLINYLMDLFGDKNLSK